MGKADGADSKEWARRDKMTIKQPELMLGQRQCGGQNIHFCCNEYSVFIADTIKTTTWFFRLLICNCSLFK
ncbi:hypothetical protein BLL42_24545 [Pseudomonas frederiksbergensis]|uniref:Uncharacterized protein n=1 Tax=Pseudomonas frederiksbergensis TaxID=104087 RepID=A0A1J0ERE4_9PSED|nr:hypothetical protein BLL42_24545 [Pseudomonas frederiksbergensis]